MENEIDAKEAVSQLFHRYGQDIYRYVRYTLGRTFDAEDVVQEVFIRVFGSWHRVTSKENIRTWLWTIVRHCIADAGRTRRRDARTPTIPLDETCEPSIGLDSVIELEEMIQRLPTMQRHVFVLRIIQDLSVAETALILGCSQAMVKYLLHRSVASLREELVQCDPKLITSRMKGEMGHG